MCSIVTFLGHLQQLAIDYTLPVLFISGDKCVPIPIATPSVQSIIERLHIILYCTVHISYHVASAVDRLATVAAEHEIDSRPSREQLLSVLLNAREVAETISVAV